MFFKNTQSSKPAMTPSLFDNNQVEVAAAVFKSRQQALDTLTAQRQALDKRFYSAITPIQENRFSIEREIEFTEQQLAFIKSYQQASADDFDHWHELYQFHLNQAIENLALDYANLLAARDFLWRDEQLVDISSKAAKAVELNLYREQLKAHANTYREFDIHANLNEKTQQLRQQIVDATLNYERLLDEQVKLTYQYHEDLYRIDAKIFALKNELQLLEQQVANPNPLEIACITGDVAYLKQTLQRNAAQVLNQQAPYALHLACRFGQLAVVDYLLALKVPVNTPDKAGYYPLHHAVSNALDDMQTTQLIGKLLAAKADATKLGPYGRNVLHTAALFGNYTAVAQFATLYPQLINQAENGRFQKNTPLHNAAYAGFSDILRLLLDKGARTDIRNGSGNTPLMEVLANANTSREKKLETMRCFTDRGIWLSPADIQQLKTLPNYTERFLPIIEQALKALWQEAQVERRFAHHRQGLASQADAIQPAMDENTAPNLTI